MKKRICDHCKDNEKKAFKHSITILRKAFLHETHRVTHEKYDLCCDCQRLLKSLLKGFGIEVNNEPDPDFQKERINDRMAKMEEIKQ